MGISKTNLTNEDLIRRLFRHDRIENSMILLDKFDDVIIKYNDYYEHNLALSLTTELNTLYSLITQHEFLLAHYYRSKHELMPKILGWCGHIYLTEHLTPLNHPMIKEQLNSDTWLPKAWLANRLLQLIDSFDNELHAPLHLCDLRKLSCLKKIISFGFSSMKLFKNTARDSVLSKISLPEVPFKIPGDRISTFPHTGL
jgi:hypothetical protein